MSDTYFRSRPISNFKPTVFMFDATNVQFQTKPLQRTRLSRCPNQTSIVKDDTTNKFPCKPPVQQKIESPRSDDQAQIEIENKSDNSKRTPEIDNDKPGKGDEASSKTTVKIDVWNQSSHGETAADAEIRLLAKESKMKRKQVKPVIVVASTQTRNELENKSDHGETTAEKEFRLLAKEAKIRKTQAILDDEDETTADAELRLLASEAKTRKSRKEAIANKKLINAMPTKGTVGSRRASLASSSTTLAVKNPPVNETRARRASMACTRRASVASGKVAPAPKPVTRAPPAMKQIVEEVDADLREKEEDHDDMMSDINKEYQAMLQRKKRRNRAHKAQ
mmetsp:Transcript_3878/g.7711  ORF Transcript_3878/g.7711 Transcript_3878/m.7711 type:complete len:337 (-) Transcript_3878:170-1180(-)